MWGRRCRWPARARVRSASKGPVVRLESRWVGGLRRMCRRRKPRCHSRNLQPAPERAVVSSGPSHSLRSRISDLKPRLDRSSRVTSSSPYSKLHTSDMCCSSFKAAVGRARTVWDDTNAAGICQLRRVKYFLPVVRAAPMATEPGNHRPSITIITHGGLWLGLVVDQRQQP